MSTTKNEDFCRNPELFAELLKNEFTNANYDIEFTENSPNTLIATFTKKDEPEDVFITNIGLPNEDKGLTVRAEPHLDFSPIAFFGFINGEKSAFIPELRMKSDEFVDFLNNRLESVQDNRDDE
ncbi:hypothetical protein [Mucilaginibacter psychrotolerans]|uniref:Uncharacterized protein n=1 Tax=Mucilaginibacter psychrotolerans TaxID=1524096 RepID=A0A4Y8S5Y2_9SPHI|nr:hypothetical protein [Mucilaginibacter psychrotolerans]TFF34398.1 hypothetical protein E2R66_22245 [Mucilaginibacter psychrotolerans]